MKNLLNGSFAKTQVVILIILFIMIKMKSLEEDMFFGFIDDGVNDPHDDGQGWSL